MNNPYRILMVVDHAFPPDVRVENEARSLIQAGFEVGLLAIGPDTRPLRENYKGIHLFRDPLHKEVRNKLRGLAGMYPFLDWYLARRIKKIKEVFDFQVLHMHDLYLFGGGLRAGRKLEVPVVGDLHENWVEALKHYAWSTRLPGKLFVNTSKWEVVEKRWVNAVDRLIVVIEEAAERNLALGVSKDNITVVPNTIFLSDFEAYEIETPLVESLQSDLTVTYTGVFDVHRGLDSVLRAMSSVLSVLPEALLVLVGDGRIRPELEKLAAQLGIASRVRFEGWQPQSRFKSYILGSDVCLVPHLKTVHTDATIPHKLFHYMYLEKPVVVSNCRPLERIVHQHQVGLSYEAGDAEDLSRQLLAIANDRVAASKMAERGHRAVIDHFNWDATVRPMVEMYKQLASSG